MYIPAEGWPALTNVKVSTGARRPRNLRSSARCRWARFNRHAKPCVLLQRSEFYIFAPALPQLIAAVPSADAIRGERPQHRPAPLATARLARPADQGTDETPHPSGPRASGAGPLRWGPMPLVVREIQVVGCFSR